MADSEVSETLLGPADYIQSSRGNKQLLHNGYIYYRSMTYGNNRNYWKCSNRTCNGKAITANEKFVGVSIQHTDHPLPITKDAVYTVEKIMDMRTVDNVTQYLIRWKGFHEDWDTWEPLENLNDCTELVKTFEKNYNRETNTISNEKNTKDSEHARKMALKLVKKSKEVKHVLTESEKNTVSQKLVKKKKKREELQTNEAKIVISKNSKENQRTEKKEKNTGHSMKKKVKIDDSVISNKSSGKVSKTSPGSKLSPSATKSPVVGFADKSIKISSGDPNIIDLTKESEVKSEGNKSSPKKLKDKSESGQGSKKRIQGKIKLTFKRKSLENDSDQNSSLQNKGKVMKLSDKVIKVKPVLNKGKNKEHVKKHSSAAKSKEKKISKKTDTYKLESKIDKKKTVKSKSGNKASKDKIETGNKKIDGKQKQEKKAKKRKISDEHDEVEVIDTVSDSDEDVLYSISPESEDKKPVKFMKDASEKDKKSSPKKNSENFSKKNSPGKKNENPAIKNLFSVKTEPVKTKIEEKMPKLRDILEGKMEPLPDVSPQQKKMKLIDSMKTKEVQPMVHQVSPSSYFTTVKPIPTPFMNMSKAGPSIPLCGNMSGYQYYPAMIPISPSSLTYRMLLESLPQQLNQKKSKKRENEDSDKEEPVERRVSVRQTECAYRYKDIVVKKCQRYTQIWMNSQSTKFKNALNPQVIQEIVAALNSAKYDDSNLVMFSGLGNVFCNGIDLNYLISGDKKVAARKMVDALRDFTKAIITFPKPIVAVVTGQAVGLGMTMLPLCDIVYASDKATFYMPYAQLGQTPEGCATYTLPVTVGMAMTNELLIAGRKITAIEACTLGLVSQVFWPTSMMQEVIPRVQTMALQSGKALETTKLLIRSHQRTKLELTNETESNLLLECWQSSECQRSIEDYLNNEKNYTF